MMKRKDEPSEQERLEKMLKSRIDSQFGGTQAKVKYNRNLQSKHKMTRNTNAMPGWSDLEGSHKGAILGGLLGVALGSLAILGLRDMEFVQNMGGLAAQLLPVLAGLLILVIITMAGFILGKATD